MTARARRIAPQKKSLSEIFNQFAKDSREHFPDLKGQVLFVDMNEYKIYGSNEIDHKKTGLTPRAADLYIKNYSITRKMRKDPDYPSHAIYEPKKDLYFLLFNERINPAEFHDISPKTEKDVMFILDHELAHLAIKGAASDKSNDLHETILGEAVADAYALMRYYQRHGTQDEHGHYTVDPFARAAALVFNEDVEHYTTFMLEKLVERKNLIDFDSLTHAQTVELAWRFAMEYTPTVLVLNRISENLKPVAEAFEKEPQSDNWLKLLASIALKPETDYHTFKTCLTLLNGYLAGRPAWDGKKADVSGPEWDAVRVKLKEKEFRLTQEDVLFNMPVIKPAPPKSPPPANQNKPNI